jgi:TonB-linked SusC/RagA family outer membrane protein
MKKNLLSLFLLGLLAFSNAFAQTKKITGKVVSADDGLPLPGVIVKVGGSQTVVVTGGDGSYTISSAVGDKLTFDFIGFTEQTLTVTAGTLPVVKLATNARLLSEVVISDGYTTQAKKSYTGAASSVSGVQNENKPFSSPLQALQGEVSGLNVTSNSGQPGANVQVRLRGVNSISANQNPLYVVDGMIINAGDLSRLTTSTNVLAGLNENDIESITVLKDAAGTAIYGSRGGSGVVLITTKKGRAGKTQVRFDMEAGATKNMAIPDAGKLLSADEFKTLFTEGENNAAADFPATFTPTRVASDIASYIGPKSNDWYDLITRTGTQQQYNVSINGGSDMTRVFASAGYFKQEATTIASSLRKVTGQLNIDHNISKRISLSSNINFSNINQFTPSNGGAFANPVGSLWFLTPFQLGYNADGSINSSRTGNTNFPSQFNPLWLAANDKKYSSQSRILTGVSLKWNIWDKLRFTSFASIDYDVLEEQQYNNPIMGDGRTSNGRGYDYYTRYFNWLTRNQFDYRYDIKGVENFYVTATAGYEAQRSQGYFITANSNGYPATQPLLTASANAATPIAGNGSFSDYTFNSFYSIAGINYKNRYTLSGSFRNDGSSVFGINHKRASFGSVGAAWNIDQESFFTIQDILSSAKIRSSYGTTGNASGLGNYSAQPTSGYGLNYAGNTGQNFNTIGNVDLTWETQKKFDVGVDFGFFADRLSFNVDYYYNNIDGLIQAAPLSRTTGFSSITKNVGAMTNKGIETTVKGYPIKTPDFAWLTSFNIAFNKNTVTALTDHAPLLSGNYQYREGMDLQTYYVRQFAGVDPANGNAQWYTDASKSVITSTYSQVNRVNKYQADPKYFGGFSNTFTYKGITVSADMYYNFGNMINDASWGYYLMDGTSFNNNKYHYIYDNRWTTPGQVTDVPKYSNAGVNGGNSSQFSTRSLYYGDYLRLKNLSVGYDLKDLSLLKKLGVSKLYIYGRGTNLWTKTYDKRLPFDPEQGVNGTNNLDVLQAKTFTIGLNVGL